MTVKKTGVTKLSARMQQKNDTEFSRELSNKTKSDFEKLSGVDTKASEKPGFYGIYPGE